MSVIVNRKEFCEILKKCYLGVMKTNVVCNYGCFLFMEGFVYSFDSYSCVAVKLPEGFDVDFMIVEAKLLKQLFEKMTGDEISLEYRDFILTVKDKGMKTKLNCSCLDFGICGIEKQIDIVFEPIKEDSWIQLPSNFIEGLKYCNIPDNNKMFAGIYVDGTDMFDNAGTHLSWFKLDKAMDEFFILDYKIKELIEAKNLKEYKVNGQWVYFRTEDQTTICLRLSDYDFSKDKELCRNLKNSFFKKGELFFGCLPSNLINILQRTLLFVEKDGNDCVVKLRFTEKGLTIMANNNVQGNKFMEDISWNREIKLSDDFDIQVSYKRLVFALRDDLPISISKFKDSVCVVSSDFTDRFFIFTVCGEDKK
jgi:hypothetical protein